MLFVITVPQPLLFPRSPEQTALQPGEPPAQPPMSQSAESGTAGSAARPASSSGGAAQPTFLTLPANTTELTVGFYNVSISVEEINERGWKTKERKLASDLAKAFQAHTLDILCLSELGEIGKGIGEKIAGGDVDAWIRGLLSDRAVPPVCLYINGHYATIVKSGRVAVLERRLVSGFVPDQSDRCFQHLRVRIGDDSEPVSIVNCHAPATRKRGLTADGRMRTFLACHEACAGDRFIWGGDFNTGVTHLTTLLQSIDDSYIMNSSAAQPGSMQLIFSHPLRFKHGDLAMTKGLSSVQVNSEVGAFFNGASNDHDLVVAKVFGLGGSRPATPSTIQRITAAYPPLTWGEASSPPCSIPHTDDAEESDSSAAQLVTFPSSAPSEATDDAEDRDSSAVQPVTFTKLILRAATPRVNAIFGSDAPAAVALQQMLEKIGREFLFGKVANIIASEDGCYEAAITPHITEKLEYFLKIVEDQRAKHVRRTPGLDADAIFTSHDMEEIQKEWRKDYKSWMNPEKIKEYERLRRGANKGDRNKAHHCQRSAFSAHLFHIIGNKHVLLACIQHPICSAAQPANVIQMFMDAWEQEKSSEEYKKRRQISERRTEEQTQRKKAAHDARWALAKARRLHDDIRRGDRNWHDLTSTDQALLDDFNSGKLTRIKAQCDPAFGWSEEMRSAMSSASSRMRQ